MQNRIIRHPAIDHPGHREEPTEVSHDAEPSPDQVQLDALKNVHPGTPEHYKVILRNVRFMSESDKGIRVQQVCGGTANFPKSCITILYKSEYCRPGDRITLVVPHWLFAKKKNDLLAYRGGAR